MTKARVFLFVCVWLLGLALLLPHRAEAAWPTDPTVNVPLCTATGNQQSPTIVADGAGGGIVTWADERSGNGDIYVQRISAAGIVQWTANGTALCTAAGSQASPTITTDGAGGAIVTWQDSRSGSSDIYAQRVSANGAVQWTTDGVALCTVAGDQYEPKIVSDSDGGAIVAWRDFRAGGVAIYAQRISAAGAPQWTPGGVAICTSGSGPGVTMEIVSDDMGGAIVTWQNSRSGSYDLYAQRISADGVVAWAAGDVALCSAPGDQVGPKMVSDGVGGAVVTWYDRRSGDWDIYAQRISAGGDVLWTNNGVPLCSALGSQQAPVITSDGMGGTILAWMDYRNDVTCDIYAQRVSANGAVQWTTDGVALCTAAGDQYEPKIVSGSGGGAIVTWYDERSGNFDIYAQRISADGTTQWMADGAALCSAANFQYVGAIASDGAGGAIVTWNDVRSGTDWDIYAQRVQANGQLGGDEWVDVPPDVPFSFALDPVRPNPTRDAALTVHFTLPTATPARLELLDVAGRRIAAHGIGSLGAGRHTLDLGQDRPLAPGLYLVRLTQGANTRTTRVVVLR